MRRFSGACAPAPRVPPAPPARAASARGARDGARPPKRAAHQYTPMELAGLNEHQARAVQAPARGQLQIIAGPGTGKTKVLVSRVAHLMRCGVPPLSIIVTTFTRKAANEMVQRLDAMTASDAAAAAPPAPLLSARLLIGTFHSICYRILRQYGRPLDIADDRDSAQLLAEAIGECALAPLAPYLRNDAVDPKRVRRAVLLLKARAVSHADYSADPFLAAVYTSYQAKLAANGLLDFDDCLLECLLLLRRHPAALRHVEHVLVDEFQDTNEIQLQLMYRFAHANNVTVVGDPDQSIYGFRDAQVGNFALMAQHYRDLQTVRLVQNYRSTADILRVSEQIMTSPGRQPKQLELQLAVGLPAVYANLTLQEEEAEWICFEIERLMRLSGAPLGHASVAVLFRSSFQTRAVEDEMVRRRLPYTMVRGKAFWQRREVVGIVDYLRVVTSDHDRVALVRILNWPRRGIGASALRQIDAALARGQGSVATLRRVEADLSGAARRGVQRLLEFLEACRGALNQPLDELFDLVYTASGLRGELGSDQHDNVAEVGRQLCLFVPQDEGLPGEADGAAVDEEHIVRRFIRLIGLYEATADETVPKISLSTIHGAKGLEWPVVFVPGLSEGVFPGPFAADGDEEEERRCLYVAATRAQYLLYLSSFTEERQRWGRPPISQVSRLVQGVTGQCSAQQRLFHDEARARGFYAAVGRLPEAVPAELRREFGRQEGFVSASAPLAAPKRVPTVRAPTLRAPTSREPTTKRAPTGPLGSASASGARAPAYIPTRDVPRRLARLKSLHKR